MYFQDVTTTLISILLLWAIFLFFQRLVNGYRQKNTWKRDILITLIQSIVVFFIVIPILNILN